MKRKEYILNSILIQIYSVLLLYAKLLFLQKACAKKNLLKKSLKSLNMCGIHHGCQNLPTDDLVEREICKWIINSKKVLLL